ncbi:hypothetical protein CVT24_006697 [Panaeolus cyanescens]|uniref:Uncharacterized protein n=1 Tax=Panaeolus cyanescens TaxID=181874 RepID=A0A409WBZ1_9AGAR|nr:hypothetical protein CVT24_006697 [Panaeolus cyanescens]
MSRIFLTCDSTVPTKSTDLSHSYVDSQLNTRLPLCVNQPRGPKHPSRSTRVSLVGARPLVRVIPATEVPDDHVLPLITFRDIEVLHHRLIDEERPQDIKYLTWLCKSYVAITPILIDGFGHLSLSQA